MEEETRLMLRMLSAVRLYFEKARVEMGGEIGAQPRQAPVLGVLARGGEMSQAEVARALNVTAATVAVSAARLEKLGYVVRRRNEDNRRANVIGLTDVGRAEAKRLGELLDRVSREALAGLTEDEREQFKRLCDRVTSNLRAGERVGKEEETC
ncbi:MAG: MarR family winged helix-turn-helix transcriptional regulator [Clostridiales bacterium]|nr:MarR family winged helix-turn-helix transcriptional regulator [Clostridiales bacterium]MDY2655755.1 MarR family winged helix-turn-helix transcriptional regulator [Candidatus Limiplasma sp.]